MPADPRTETIDTIRALAMDAVQKANAGHPGTAMALARVAYLLYRDVLRHNPADPHWPGRDRFILSAGHACMLQYASLHLSGYDVTIDDLEQFRQWGSRTPGHPECGHTRRGRDDDGAARPGLRERRRHGDRAALPRRPLQPPPPPDRRQLDLRDLLRRRPDGRGHAGGGLDRRPPRARPARLRLRRQPHHDRRHDLDLVHDRGQGQAVRGVRLARPARRRLGGPRRAPRRARGGEGGGGAAVADRSPHVTSPTRRRMPSTPPRRTAPRSGRPRCARRRRRWASIRTRPSPSPTRCASTWRSCAERGAEQQREWEERLAALGGRVPRARARARARPRREPREGWREALPVFPAGEDVATRDAGRKVMQALKPFTPTMVGGAADLVESTKTEFEGAGVFVRDARRPQHRLRDPRARDGLDRERDRARPRDAAPLRLHLPHLLRLHAARRAALGADGAPQCLGVDARLGRGRRGRPDAPAGRAPHGAAGDPEPLVRPPRRRERDRDGVADRARAARTGRWRSR